MLKMSPEFSAAVVYGIFFLIATFAQIVAMMMINKRKHSLETQRLNWDKKKADNDRIRILYGDLEAYLKEVPSETPDVFDQEKKTYQEAIRGDNHEVLKRTIGLDVIKANNEMESLGKFHENKARELWPLRDVPSAYRCAYHYELAAECYKRSENSIKSGWLWHFAGHKYRSEFEWDKAGTAYISSADMFKRGSRNDLAKRSAKRAVGCYRQVEETQLMKDIKEQYKLND